jgi:DNA-binding NarL/FixJ family response regulator
VSITIHIADDHSVFRAGLRALIEKEPDFEVLGESGNSFDTLKEVRNTRPEVLILDVNMPGMTTSSVVETLAVELPEISVLILTIHDEEYYLKEFLKAGAKGFMVKTSTGRELIHAIRTVHQGKTYIDPGISQNMIDSYLGGTPKRTQDDEILSKREKEVFDKLIYGYTNEEAAKELSISKRTVESHRASIMKKLNLKSRTELVRYALQHGLLKTVPPKS